MAKSDASVQTIIDVEALLGAVTNDAKFTKELQAALEKTLGAATKGLSPTVKVDPKAQVDVKKLKAGLEKALTELEVQTEKVASASARRQLLGLQKAISGTLEALNAQSSVKFPKNTATLFSQVASGEIDFRTLKKAQRENLQRYAAYQEEYAKNLATIQRRVAAVPNIGFGKEASKKDPENPKALVASSLISPVAADDLKRVKDSLAQFRRQSDVERLNKADEAQAKAEAKRIAREARAEKLHQEKLKARYEAEEAAAAKAEAKRIAREAREQQKYQDGLRKRYDAEQAAAEKSENARITREAKAQQKYQDDLRKRYDAKQKADAAEERKENARIAREARAQQKYQDGLRKRYDAEQAKDNARIAKALKAERDYQEKLRVAYEARVAKEAAADQKRAEAAAIRAASVARGERELTRVHGIEHIAAVNPDTANDVKAALRDRLASAKAALEVGATGQFALNPDQIRRATTEVRQLEDALRRLSTQQRTTGTDLERFGRVVSQFVRYAVGYQLGYQILNEATATFAGAVKFEDELRGIQAIAKSTTEELGSLAQAVVEVAKEGHGLDDIAAAAQTLAQAGVSIKELPAALRATARGALATGGTPGQFADILTSQRAINPDKTDTALADEVVQAANISKLALGDIQTIISLGAQTAKSVNLTSQQFLGAAATLRNVGLKPSTVATGSRELFLELFSPDQKTIDFLRKRYAALNENLGDAEIRATFQAFKDADNPLVAALTELRRLGVAGAARNDFSRTLETRAENVILPLLDNLDKLAANTARIGSPGSAAEGAELRVQSLSNALTRLQATATAATYSLTDGLLKGLRKLVDGAATLIDTINTKITERQAKGDPGGATLTSAIAVGAGAAAITPGGPIKRTAAAISGAATAAGLSGAAQTVSGALATFVDYAVAIAAYLTILRSRTGQLSTTLGKIAEMFGGVVAGLQRFGILRLLTLITLGISELQTIYDKATGGDARKQLAAARVAAEQAALKDAANREAFEAYNPANESGQTAQANKLVDRVDKFNTTLDDVFGAKAEQVAELVKELGDSGLEAGSDKNKQLIAEIQKATGQALSGETIRRLSTSAAELIQTQADLFGRAQEIVGRAARLLARRNEGEDLSPDEQAFLEQFQKRQKAPVFNRQLTTPAETTRGAQDIADLFGGIFQQANAKSDTSAEKFRDIAVKSALDFTAKGQELQRTNLQQLALTPDDAKALRESIKTVDEYTKAVAAKRAELGGIGLKGGLPDPQLGRFDAATSAASSVRAQLQQRLAAAEAREAEAAEAAAKQKEANLAKPNEFAKETQQLADRQRELEARRVVVAEETLRLDTELLRIKETGEYDKALKTGGLLDQRYKVSLELLQIALRQKDIELRNAAKAQGVDLPANLADVTTGQFATISANDTLKNAFEARNTAAVKLYEEQEKAARARADLEADRKADTLSSNISAARAQEQAADRAFRREAKEPRPDAGKLAKSLEDRALYANRVAILERLQASKADELSGLADEELKAKQESIRETTQRLALERGTTKKAEQIQKQTTTTENRIQDLNQSLLSARQRYQDALSAAANVRTDNQEFQNKLGLAKRKIGSEQITPLESTTLDVKTAEDALKRGDNKGAFSSANQLVDQILNSVKNGELGQFDGESLLRRVGDVGTQAGQNLQNQADQKATLAKNSVEALLQDIARAQDKLAGLRSQAEALQALPVSLDFSKIEAQAAEFGELIKKGFSATVPVDVKVGEGPPAPPAPEAPKASEPFFSRSADVPPGGGPARAPIPGVELVPPEELKPGENPFSFRQSGTAPPHYLEWTKNIPQATVPKPAVPEAQMKPQGSPQASAEEKVVATYKVVVGGQSFDLKADTNVAEALSRALYMEEIKRGNV